MSTTFASLGIAVESSQAVKAADDLDKLVDAAEGAEKAVDDLGKAGDGLANTGKKISQAEAEAAQGIDKATSAKERQVDASRKAGTSAASEIAIISQLDRAMTGNIDSMEKLVQAEGLLERARKGGLVTIEQQEAYQERLGKSFDKIEKAEAKEMAQKQRLIDAENRQIEALKRTVNSIDPLNVKLAKLEAQEKAAHEAFRLGAINAERYSEALAKVGKDRAGITATEGAFDKLKLGTRQAQENVMQLANALQSGDWGSGARAVAQLGAGAGASAASLLSMAAPIALAAAAVGTLAAAYFQGVGQAEKFNDALIASGGAAGKTTAQLTAMSLALGKGGNLSQASEALLAIVSSGELTGSTFDSVARAATELSVATGRSSGEIAKQLISNKGDVAALATEYNRQYHFMSAETYSHIQVLQTQGDEMGALELLTNQLADSMAKRNKDIENSARGVVGAWRDARKAFSDYWGEFTSRAGADQDTFTLQVKQGQLEDVRAQPESSLRTKAIANLEKEIALIEQRQSAKQKELEQGAKSDAITQKGIDAERELEGIRKASYTNKQKRDKEEEKYLRNIADLREANPNSPLLDQKLIDRDLENIRSKYKDTKTAAGAVDLTAFNNSKNNLTGILSEYKNAQKELDAAQKAGLVSQADYLLKREAMIGNERDEVTAAYEAEIAALEAAKGKASTSAAQRIQLEQKIADARAAMVKAQRDADTELSVLAKNEEGRLKKQELAVKTYTSALQQQVDTLREQGMRAAAGLGQGDRQRDLTNQQNAIDDRINQQKLDLANQYGDGSRGMSLDEYTQKLQALEATQQKLHDTVVSNYDDMSAAQGDWTNGASSAWQNYLESARDVAGQTKSLFTNAYGSMEDAIVQFAMTGKSSFADFTKSILADMARIATRQASSSALSSLFGMAASAAGSYFGGGAASAGSTQAGYTGVDFSSYQANGGGWDCGVQFFKDGGAFTNSIVSKPTAFGMAGGKTGVVGEAGPEAIVPLARTSGGQLGIRALGGASSSSNNQVVIQQTFNVPEGSGGASEADGQVLAQAYAKSAKQGAQEQIAKDLRPGGQIYMAIRGRG
ncbi:phage tail tape measure protein [Pseudomonas protegens]|uniref:phage tail tape measure protein n=1 Tax=Pseudomonas protegens TaxID=380021 RepID=UPI00069D1414|nr:phage tail tape measure protein [Pseudomonas protegens]